MPRFFGVSSLPDTVDADESSRLRMPQPRKHPDPSARPFPTSPEGPMANVEQGI